MGLDKEVLEYKRELRKKIGYLRQRHRHVELAELVLANCNKVKSLTRKIIPEKAIPLQKLKCRLGWPHEPSNYKKTKQGKLEIKIYQRLFKFEEELLEARHPKRVKKLWKAAKPRLEERYGRSFKNREELAIMNAISNRLIESFDKPMEKIRNYLRKTKFFNEAEMEYIRRIRRLYHNGYLKWSVVDGIRELLGLVEDVLRPKGLLPKKQVKEDYDPFDLPDSLIDEYKMRHSSGIKSIELPKHNTAARFYYRIDDGYIVDFIRRGRKKQLEFSDVFGTIDWRLDKLRSSKLLDENDAIRRHFFFGMEDAKWEIPNDIKKMIYSEMKRCYSEKTPELKKFMKWFKGHILERWEATAEDYDKVLQFHYMDGHDKGLVETFYRVKLGKEYPGDELISIGRLPGVLRAMIADGFLKESEIDPPLKDKYRKPNEVLTNLPAGNLLPAPSDQKHILALPESRNQGIIKLHGNVQKLLPTADKSHLENLATNLKGLEDFMDTKDTYYFLGKGKHTAFFTRELKYETGSLGIGTIYRFSLLKDDAKAKEGVELVVNNEKVNIKKEKSWELNEEMFDKMLNANSDIINVKSYTAIVDSSVDEFKRIYFKDFMMHAFIHFGYILFKDLKGAIDYIDELDSPFLEVVLSPTAKVKFKTFQIGDKFCFSLTHKSEIRLEELPVIAKTLVNYLEEVGLDFHYENNLDEAGRASLATKLEDRKFQRENMPEILKSLEGDGLIRVLSYFLTNKEYESESFSESYAPCEHCKKKYITVNAYNPKVDRYQFGVRGGDLHVLANHPMTFVNKFGNLQKIYRAIKESKDHKPPVIYIPELEKELREFAETFDDSVEANTHASNFFIDWQGSLSSYEQEEIEDSKELQELIAKQDKLTADEKKYRAISDEKLTALHEKYMKLTGDCSLKGEEIYKIRSFWTDQLLLYKTYQLSSPKLLTTKGCKYLLDLPVNFSKG